jgi:polyisoprenyl-phosphate glycosyltransferase
MNSAAVPVIELIVPVFNEGPVIESHLQEILKRAVPEEPAGYRLKLLVIDDGSRDGTREALDCFCAREPRARYLSFTRNFGKESAISAGLDQVSDDADAAILMDSDLQHPPELIPRMVELWRAGNKVVEARKSSRGRESLASRLFATGFYRLFRLLAKLDLRGQSDFKLLDRAVVAQYRSLHEQGRFFRGLVQWMGYPAAHISFEVPERAGGNSNWSRIRLLRYALHNITAFSATPLQFISWCGLVSVLVGVVFGALAFIQKIRGEALDGFTTVILLLIFFSGALMLSLGVIGHYLALIYEEIKHRPGYILRPDEPRKEDS